ncbi:MAG: MFS transporter [Gemmatimonadales bacterium]|nr:MFS transporter [Gemmatimonadales bacterium]
MTRRTLLNRDFLLLWQGQFVSQLGNQAFSLAMVYWLMEATGSASLMGLLMMVSLLPGVVIGPLGGAIADRHSRLGIIVVSDLVRGLAVLALAGVMFLRPQGTELIVGMLFAVALFSGLVNAVFQPAIAAAIPDLVPPQKVAAGNSLTQFSVQASVLVGQAAGGLLYRFFGAAYLFFIDGATYLVSAFSEAFIRIPQKRPGEKLPTKQTLAAYISDTVEGIRFVWRRPGMRSFLLVASGVNFLAMPVIILLPFYVADRLVKDSAWYGFLLAALGAGSLLGYLVAGTIRISARRRPWLITSALIGTGTLLATVGFVRGPVIALALFFGVGTCTGAINIFVITLFQIATPSDMRGRVIALVIALSGAATPLGMALGGLLGDATNKNIPLIYFACGALIGLLVVGAATRRTFHEFLEWDAPATSGAF